MAGFDYANAFGSALGGMLNFQSQRETNSTNAANVARTNEYNLRIARETNQQNYQNLLFQNKWNLEQWNRENAYNSPAAQRGRLLQAGINAYDAVNSGNGASIQSANANPAVAPTMQSFQATNPFSGVDLGSIVSSFIDGAQRHEQLKQERLRTSMMGVDAALYLDEKINALRKSIYERRRAGYLSNREKIQLNKDEYDLKYYDAVRSLERKQADQNFQNSVKEGQQIDAGIANMAFQNRMQSIQAKASFEHMKFEERLSAAVAAADIKLKNSEAAKLKQETVKLRNEIANYSQDKAIERVKSYYDWLRDNYSLDVARAAVESIFYDLRDKHQMSNSMIRDAMLHMFGTSVDQVFGAGVNVGLGR